ncbi:MAG: ABC transporter ATP-binding protein [Bradyrhizobium sp.]
MKSSRVSLLGRAMRLVWQSAPAATVAKAAVLLIQGGLPIVSLYLTKLMIDAVTAGALSPDPDFARALWFIVGLGGVAVAAAVCMSLATFLGEAQEHAVADHVVALVLAKSVAVDLAHYEDPTYYDTLHRAQQEASHRPMRVVDGLGQLGQSGVALAALVGLLLSLHWVIAVVLVAAALPGTLLRLNYSQRLYEWQRRATPVERQSWYFHWLLTGEAYAKEIRLFDFGGVFVQRVNDLRRNLRRMRLRLTARRAVGELIGEIASILAIFGALAYIAQETLLGAITVGSLVMYYQAFQKGQTYLREVLGALAHLYEDTLFLGNLFEFLDVEPLIVAPRAARALPRQMQGGIEINHVRLVYGGSERPVLDDITMSIRPGEHIALVGANGAGKTTLVKLLCRLYDPTAGNITLDGIDLRELDLAALRREISVVFQDYARYDLTVRENIWLGNVLLEPNDHRIAAAAHAAGATAMIGKLPRGYETRLGKWFDDEQELSIGEWQKIALARAFVRDARIVVLDEPTSALDPSAEYEVFRKFRELAAGRTTILISHRFSTVRTADRIYVLTNGRITESGSHDELMGRGGEYARMFELQAVNYR